LLQKTPAIFIANKALAVEKDNELSYGKGITHKPGLAGKELYLDQLSVRLSPNYHKKIRFTIIRIAIPMNIHKR
jgi:hypothetical protein